MVDNVDNIVLEHLRAMRADMAKMSDNMRTLATEMTAMRQHMAGFSTIQDHDHDLLYGLKDRIERIERRLDLTD